METVVIALEELAHYAESTARTMPVTGVVPRAVAEDQIRHALRALREKRRRLDASAPDGGARWLLDNLWLCEREGASALAAFHAAGRLRTTCEGALVPALCRVLLASGGGRVDEERIAVFLEGFQRKTPLTGRELALLGAAVLVRLAQLYRGETPSGAAAAVYFTALRHIASLDLDAVLEEADAVEHILRRDPAGVYQRMDERSRRDTARASKRFRGGKIKARRASRRRRCALPSAPRASGGVISATGSMKIPSARACRGEAARRTFSQTSFSRLRSPRRARCGQKASSRECWRCCRSRKS